MQQAIRRTGSARCTSRRKDVKCGGLRRETIPKRVPVPDDFTEFLRENGYDHVVAPHGERSEYYYIPQPSQLPARLHHTQWVGDKTLEFFSQRDTDRPFLCWSSFIKPHPPFESPVPWNRLYRTVEMPLPFLPSDYEHLHTYWNRHQNRYKYRGPRPRYESPADDARGLLCCYLLY